MKDDEWKDITWINKYLGEVPEAELRKAFRLLSLKACLGGTAQQAKYCFCYWMGVGHFKVRKSLANRYQWTPEGFWLVDIWIKKSLNVLCLLHLFILYLALFLYTDRLHGGRLTVNLCWFLQNLKQSSLYIPVALQFSSCIVYVCVCYLPLHVPTFLAEKLWTSSCDLHIPRFFHLLSVPLLTSS